MSLKVISLVRNAFNNDARVNKTAESFSDWGYNITVIAEKAYRKLPVFEKGRFKVIRVPLFSSLYAVQTRESYEEIQRRQANTFVNKVYRLIRKNKIRLAVVSSLNTVSYNLFTLITGVLIKPSLIIANDLNTLLTGFLIARVVKAKLIYDSHEIWFYGGVYNSAGKLKKLFWRWLEKKIIYKVDDMLVTTETRAGHFKKKYGIQDIKVLRNCPKLQIIPHNQLLREEFNIPESHKILIYHGLLKRIRGIFDLLEAMEFLDNCVLVFMGNGKDKSQLFEEIISRNLADRVFLKDPVKYQEVVKIVASADIGLQPFHYTLNHYTVISNKLLECIMAGIASIGSDFPEMKKVIEGHAIGFVHQEKNIQQIVEALKKLIQNEELLDSYKANACEIRELYSWEREVLVYKDIIKALAL